MTYYCAVEALTLLTLGTLCLLVYENGRFPLAQRRGLYAAYALIAASSIAEFCGVVLNGLEGIPPWPLMIAKCADYTLTPFAGGALIRQLGMRNRWNTVLIGVLVGNAVLQLAALAGGWVVAIDAHNHYSHGPLYPMYVLSYLAVLAILVIQFVSYGRSFSRQNRASLYATVTLVVAGIALQELLGAGVRTAYLSLALGASLLFIRNSEFKQLVLDETIGVQQTQIMTDALTGVMSRRAYAQRIDASRSSDDVPDDVVVFSVDLNGLKEVNDTYGHDAGDELIRAAAACVARTFADRGACYRTGGDEFVAIVQMGRSEAEEALGALLRDADTWRGEAVSSMSLAAGYALAADHPGLTLGELVSKADRSMYAAKEEHYRGFDSRRR